ncbi:unnamed protein product [Psylliodes chrysocephalus]|uniref:Uncharacterized protein n=1 Tax=Psylliodes chrysocephalus TaxID=3402493 RepID=A0A9P0GKD1_9CUCU|nr:unnamed protein product [Psylliodes chrysocephala]
MESEILKTMDINDSNSKMKEEGHHKVDDITDKKETNNYRTEKAKEKQGIGKHKINKVIYKENTAGTSSAIFRDSTSDEMSTKTKTRRKRFKVEKATWFSEKNINRREKGKRYFDKTKVNGKWSYDIKRVKGNQRKAKKDKCEICNKLKKGYITEEDYNNHMTRKRKARSEMEKDKENEKCVYTVHLQAVLFSPKSNINSLYY